MSPVLDTIHEYYKAFSTLDLTAIASYYCEPCMTIAPQGVFAAGTRAALADSLVPLVGGLKAKGYGRSEFRQPQLTMLGESDAIVRGLAMRYTTAGAELETVPLSYLMHRTGGGWKIAALVAESSK